MIRTSSINVVDLATVAVSVVLRLEPEEVDMLVASGRQVVASGHVVLMSVIAAVGVRSRPASRSNDRKFACEETLSGMMCSAGALR